MKIFKKIIWMIVVLALTFNSITVFAEDNADSGSGNTNNAAKDKGFYRGSEYMYKVSVYVGLSDKADKKSDLSRDWKIIGSSPIYIKPASFTLATNAMGGSKNKVSYLNGSSLNAITISAGITDNPPPIPITNGGNINSVKSYFGDTETLNNFIDAFASQKGTTKEGLVSNINFTIKGETKRYPADEILPIKVNGVYQNKVPWLIIYEPVIISYLKGRKKVLAFTATEYALAQKRGYFNFKFGSTGQYISGMTHSDLPNSIILEESWFGYPVTSALPDRVYWSEDRIISGGGWGMRMLKANATNVVENDTTYDYEYRVNTDVITSVRIYASKDITPDNRHKSESTYKNPKKNTATVTMTANGYSKSTEVVIPSGGSELVWIKWHTPSTPRDVVINVKVTGNSAAKIDGKSRSATITGKVVDLGLNPPPNPTANDTNKGFLIPSIPVKADKSSANWGIYSCRWIPNWIWYPKWEWESNWVKKSYRYHHSGGCKENGSCPGHRRTKWVDRGKWVDNGRWVDEGNWKYDFTNYKATLSANINLYPDSKAPTARSNTMKSGYGVNIDVSTNPYSNAPSSHITYAQNVISYFPEFNYQSYWRLFDMISYGNFEFKKNKYSTYNNRAHFTPIWYPDGRYKVYAEVIDMWTPDGMLRVNLDDDINIDGNLYEDWHIGPK
ncbi:hypothetical protein IZY60_03460 [Lutibacter sp. B2]|nr:hypothetical protein [Lutibacter sp. B2]